MECDRQEFVILDYFLPFYPSNNPENQNFEKKQKKKTKKKKTKKLEDIIIHMCIINENHMMYGS